MQEKKCFAFSRGSDIYSALSPPYEKYIFGFIRESAVFRLCKENVVSTVKNQKIPKIKDSKAF